MARLFVDNLTVIDFSFLEADRGVVGESWIVDIELAGELDDQGMVFDFGHVKKQIKQFIDAQADHRLLVPTASPACRFKKTDDELLVRFQLSSGAVITHRSPAESVLLVEAEAIDSEHIAGMLQTQLKGILPENVYEIVIKLRTENIDGAYYQYTHGLQQHLGQCQRIAHGHRSRLEIEIDDQRSEEQEKLWADRLVDIYIATENHVLEEFEFNGIQHTRMGYKAAQGDFNLSLPSSQVFIMPYVSTVENIAAYLAETIAEETSSKVLVKAFEGVEKGAIGKAAKE